MIVAPNESDSLPVDCAGVRGGTVDMVGCGCIGGTIWGEIGSRPIKK